uniref:Major facilitator superfamily (MFS) profile domain-containing protein n=1 Tax=Bionectria ochroleuca TaxID=29856 RepID=A0A0B7KQH1_BIOOC
MSQTATLTETDIGDGAIELGHRPSQESKTSPVAREVRETETALQDESPPPTNARHEVERWNWPRGNVPRLGFAFLSFIIAGMNDAAIGALIPYLEQYYNLTYTIVSLVFLTPFAGYALAAFTNARIHVALGQRGVAIMAPLCHIVTYVALCLHPPYPVLVVINIISGFGNGLTDACFCAWVGAMDKANTIQGFMHSCYSIGALLAPLIATEFVVTLKRPWYEYYYVMVGISVIELVGLSMSFWRKTGAVYRSEHVNETGSEGAGTRVALKSKVTWLCSVFFFAYMGVEVGLGGWVTTFMLRVRKASPYASGISSTAFWAGQAFGRASLGFVTERFGERICVTIYLAICIGLQLLFWLVPRFIVSVVAVAFLGMFLGPLFPGAVMVTAKLLPKHIHVSAIGFAMALGGTGGTVFPFIIGAIASSKGVEVLQPIILALIVVVSIVWLSFPRIKKPE